MTITGGITKPTFLINSHDRMYGSDSDFTVKLPINHSMSFDQCALISAMIPKSWYTVDSNNNQFTLSEGTSSSVITIATANYDAFTFQDTLFDALNDNSPHNYGYSVSFDESALKYTVVVSGNGGVQPSLTFSGCSPHSLFGELRDTTASFSSDSWTSNHAVLFQNTKYVTIKCSIVEDHGKVGHDPDVLAHIPVENIPDGGMINYSINLLEAHSRILKGSNNLVRFGLYDDCGGLMNMNNHFVKLIFMTYNHNRYYEMASHNIINENAIKYSQGI